jgi:nifR3 family TIM-barrel protein
MGNGENHLHSKIDSFNALFRSGPGGRPPLFLAPMAGFTNAATRRIAGRHGAVLTYTEMTNAAGLVHASDKTWQILETFADEVPVVAHLYGTDPASFAEAARHIAATGRFCAIDLNAGCPVPKITRSGAGSALIGQPTRIGQIIAAIRAACDLPVTVKTRLGPHPGAVAIFDILQAAEDAGASALAIHGRYTSQGHTGPVDIATVAAVRQRAGIPIIGNGGIADLATARLFVETSGVDALMIGQAAIGRPWIFETLAEDLAAPGQAGARPRLSLDTLRTAIFAHLDAEVERLSVIAANYPLPNSVLNPESAAVIGFRCHFFRYLTGLRGVAWARGQLCNLHTLDQIRDLVDGCLAREAAYRARGEALRLESAVTGDR